MKYLVPLWVSPLSWIPSLTNTSTISYFTLIKSLYSSNVAAKGSDADLCIFDLNEPWKVDVSKLKSKSKNAAIENRKLQGKVLMTYLKGESF